MIIIDSIDDSYNNNNNNNNNNDNESLSYLVRFVNSWCNHGLFIAC